jgi:hypothetical protein
VNWTTIWLDTAEADLLQQYLLARAAGLADEYTQAAARIEQLLATDPTQAGESRAGHRRIAVESPLTVEFEVHPDPRIAIVTRVRYTPGR